MPNRSTTAAEIDEILESGELTKLVGIIENDVFEAKRSLPYSLNSSDVNEKSKARIEMAEDITSFANKEKGGIILLGLVTPDPGTTDIDEVLDLDLISKEDFYYKTEVIKGMLNGVVTPIPEIEVGWKKSKENTKKGIGYIRILPSNFEKRYFVVTAFQFNEKTTASYGKYFSIPVRNDSKKDFLDSKTLRKHMKQELSNTERSLNQITDGLDVISNKVEEIISKLDGNISKTSMTSNTAVQKLIDRKIADILKDRNE